MIEIRKSAERGHFDHGWLNTYHTFSFSDYHDPKHMGFRSLRVINEDFVTAGEGFDTHGHKDMEIITYVLQGALAHKDSMGNGSAIHPGEVQYMSAGKGVRHSEFNHSKSETVHLLQIWILPNELKAEPRYDQKAFSRESRQGKLLLVASPDGAEGSIAIRQDARLFASILNPGVKLERAIETGRHAWLQLVRGESLKVNGQAITAGDGVALTGEKAIQIENSGKEEAEFLLFDLN